jgi:hypothetical protein
MSADDSGPVIENGGKMDPYTIIIMVTIGVRMCQFFSRGQKVPRFITYVS